MSLTSGGCFFGDLLQFCPLLYPVALLFPAAGWLSPCSVLCHDLLCQMKDSAICVPLSSVSLEFMAYTRWMSACGICRSFPAVACLPVVKGVTPARTGRFFRSWVPERELVLCLFHVGTAVITEVITAMHLALGAVICIIPGALLCFTDSSVPRDSRVPDP